jgi:methionine aminopeptidase
MNESKNKNYTLASSICKQIFTKLKDLILTKTELSLKTLSLLGNQLILEQGGKVAFPISISLNNCVGNYLYDSINSETIQENDLVKIHLGVSVNKCIVQLCETFFANGSNHKHIDFLNKIQKKVLKMIKHGETNDETRIMIESMCTNENVFPVENCISYEQIDSNLKQDDSKYLILNHTKYYDSNDYLISEENICYEFEINEVYTIDLSIVENSEDDKTLYINLDPQIYRFNEFNQSLKLKSSREFLNKIKSLYSTFAFDINPYKDNVKNRIGIKECIEKGLLEPFPIKLTKNKENVFSKKFTIIVGENSSTLL